VGVSVTVGVAVRLGDGVRVAVLLADGTGVRVRVGVAVGAAVRTEVGVAVGITTWNVVLSESDRGPKAIVPTKVYVPASRSTGRPAAQSTLSSPMGMLYDQPSKDKAASCWFCASNVCHDQVVNSEASVWLVATMANPSVSPGAKVVLALPCSSCTITWSTVTRYCEVAVGVGSGVRVAVGERDGVLVAVGVADWVAAGVMLGTAVGNRVPVGVTVMVGVEVGLAVSVGLRVAVAVAVRVAVGVGLAVCV
jgi:hypothetical protein